MVDPSGIGGRILSLKAFQIRARSIEVSADFLVFAFDLLTDARAIHRNDSQRGSGGLFNSLRALSLHKLSVRGFGWLGKQIVELPRLHLAMATSSVSSRDCILSSS